MSSVNSRITPDQWTMTMTPLFAAVTTICASTALAGVIQGIAWLGYSGLAVVVVTGTGLTARALRAPTFVVGMAQLLMLLCLVVTLFSDQGWLGFLPGPDALAQIGGVIKESVVAVQTGVPPVPSDDPILALVVMAIGLVAVMVDTLAVAAGTPAACGLVLLCVYAVPASLAEEMLPWWSFALGAASFATLLAADGAHRHQVWRNRPSRAGTSGRLGSLTTPTALVSVAVLLGVFAGSQATLIGTVGRLPGGNGSGGSGGLGIKPFTELRGMLDQGSDRELFRVRGLGDQGRYLRALTLRDYTSNQGWQPPERIPAGMPVGGDLPRDPDTGRGAENLTEIQIEPVNSEDFWAPVYGLPRKLSNLPADMRYDTDTGIVYSERTRKLEPYIEHADLSEPTADQLRVADSNLDDVDSVYTKIDGLDPRVAALAREITAGKPTMFDKAVALQRYFGPENGFSYQTRTAGPSDQDALVDFLFRGKIGFCEQYASAMAVLARAVGIPSRVAIGYTAGYAVNGYRSIGTRDAHAWVEVYFPDHGWVTFDPTPLSDGRAYTPPYLTTQSSVTPNLPDSDAAQPTTTVPVPPPTTGLPLDPETAQAGGPAPGEESGSGAMPVIVALLGALVLGITVLAVIDRRERAAGLRRRVPPGIAPYLVPMAVVGWSVVAVLTMSLISWWLAVPLALLGLAAVPAGLRVLRKRSRLNRVQAQDPSAAMAAWDEVLAESWDRGVIVSDTETVRTAAQRLVKEHKLDDDGQEGLRTMIGVLERSWYSTAPGPDPALPQAFERVRHSLDRNAPLALRAKLLPRSILRPRRRTTSADTTQEQAPPIQV
jgi:transglutaminase-like putative cysteine protease